MAKCPVCKEELSFEMLPVGTDPGKSKKKLKMGEILPQVINWTIDTSLRACVGSGRSLYLTCNNGDCPCCYKPTNPIYFKQPVGGFAPQIVGDALGIRLTLLQGQYNKKRRGGG